MIEMVHVKYNLCLMNMIEEDYLLYSLFSAKMSLEEKLKLDRLSTDHPIKSQIPQKDRRQNCMFSVFLV